MTLTPALSLEGEGAGEEGGTFLLVLASPFQGEGADSLYLSLQGEEQEGLRQLPSSIFTRFGIPAP